MPAATIVVTTKDRCDDLRTALHSALAQTADAEVLVIDDGSTDGTAAMVAQEFPTVRLHREDRPAGPIIRRNQAAQLARGQIVVSLDDDAHFPSRRTVEQTLADFDHPRIGAVAIPFVDTRKGPELRQRAPDDSRRYLTSTFIGTACALRLDVFRAVGGYRTSLVPRQAEEPDLCLRMLDAGFVTRLGRAEPLVHDESPKRDLGHVYFHAFRNDMLHGWNNVPMPYLPVRLVKATILSTAIAVRTGHLGPLIRGTSAGHATGLRAIRRRNPVQRSTYRVDHLIRRRRPVVLEDVEHRLPPLLLNLASAGSGPAVGGKVPDAG